jgi:hypothetical protein
LTRGVARRLWKLIPVAVEFAGERNRGGEAAARPEGREGRQRGVEWGQGDPGRPGGAPNGGAGQLVGGNSGGGGAELRRGGRRKKGWSVLCVNTEKFRDLEVN